MERTDAVRSAVELLESCATPAGFVAATDWNHYDSVWARDACITSLGALEVQHEDLESAVGSSISSLTKHMGPLGQVPNTIWPRKGCWDWGENGSVDGTGWYVLIACRLLRRIEGVEADRLSEDVERALSWLRHQDVTGTGLLSSPNAGDWMDSSLNRGGRVLYVNAVYAWALNAAEEAGIDTGRGPSYQHVADAMNAFFWPCAGLDLEALLWSVADSEGQWPHVTLRTALEEAARSDRRYYLSSVNYGSVVDVCDVLGQVIAVLAGVADAEKSNLIADYLHDAGVADPFPSKTFDRTMDEASPEGMFDSSANARQSQRWRNPPYEYHNAGSWPFIGGFHVRMLAQLGRDEEARTLLSRLEEANRGPNGEWLYPEWRHGRDGSVGGSMQQAWSAAMYLYARSAL